MNIYGPVIGGEVQRHQTISSSEILHILLKCCALSDVHKGLARLAVRQS